MDGFKLPQTIPQDLLIIQEFIDVPKAKSETKNSIPISEPNQEDIASSGGESDDDMESEDEIAADLTKVTPTDEDNGGLPVQTT